MSQLLQERFGIRKLSLTDQKKPVCNPNRPQTGMGLAVFSDIVSGTTFTQKREFINGCYCVRKRRLDLRRDGFPHIVGGDKRCTTPKTAVQICICPASNKKMNSCVLLPTRPRPRHHHETRGLDSAGDDYESLCHSLRSCECGVRHVTRTLFPLTGVDTGHIWDQVSQ